ncbi:hypothetical protein FRC01_004269, partial [Tulasnella sp. 417]
MRRALEKSKSSTINLDFHVYNGVHIDFESFMAEAGPHIARWRLVKVVIRTPKSWESALGRFTTAQAPSLESLELRARIAGHLRSQNVISLFNGAPAPSTLKYLTLSRIPVAVEPLGLAGLVSLDLTEIPNISTSELLEILRNSPRLENLALDDNPGLIGIGSQLSAVPPIALPKLTVLGLELIDPEGTNCILSKIRIPSRHRVDIIDIDIRGVSVTDVLFTPAIAHILHTNIPAPDPRFSDINIEVTGSHGCTIKVRGIELSLLVDGEDQIEGILSWLVEGLGSEAAACPVRLKLEVSGMDPVRLVALPSPLVIKHLSIPESLLRSLLQSPRVAIFQPSNPTSFGRLLVEVESLAVEFGTMKAQEEFIVMLKLHTEAMLTIGTESRGPVSLKSIELRGRSRVKGLVEQV